MVWVIRITGTFPQMDGDGCKYYMVQFGKMSM